MRMYKYTKIQGPQFQRNIHHFQISKKWFTWHVISIPENKSHAHHKTHLHTVKVYNTWPLASNLLQDSSRKLRRRRHFFSVPSSWETSLFNGWTHTHTLATSQRDLPQSSFDREKTHQKVSTSTKSDEKPQKVHIVASTEGDNERAQYPSFKHIFI